MEVKNIKKSYGKKTILERVSFSAEKGQCVGILGGNGSGKSTLLKILSGIIKCDKGKFMYDDADLLKSQQLRSNAVGYIPQNTPLIEELTALDNLRLWYDADSLHSSLYGGVLNSLGINEFLNVHVCKMSGGMKKRLAIGCAVSKSPQILILDEPSSALDIICKETIANYIKDFKNKNGTVIIATHDLHELPLCDVLFILKDGKLKKFLYDGNPESLVSQL